MKKRIPQKLVESYVDLLVAYQDEYVPEMTLEQIYEEVLEKIRRRTGQVVSEVPAGACKKD